MRCLKLLALVSVSCAVVGVLSPLDYVLDVTAQAVESKKEPKKVEADRVFEQGEQQIANGRYAEAIKTFEGAIALSPINFLLTKVRNPTRSVIARYS